MHNVCLNPVYLKLRIGVLAMMFGLEVKGFALMVVVIYRDFVCCK